MKKPTAEGWRPGNRALVAGAVAIGSVILPGLLGIACGLLDLDTPAGLFLALYFVPGFVPVGFLAAATGVVLMFIEIRSLRAWLGGFLSLLSAGLLAYGVWYAHDLDERIRHWRW